MHQVLQIITGGFCPHKVLRVLLSWVFLLPEELQESPALRCLQEV